MNLDKLVRHDRKVYRILNSLSCGKVHWLNHSTMKLGSDHESSSSKRSLGSSIRWARYGWDSPGSEFTFICQSCKAVKYSISGRIFDKLRFMGVNAILLRDEAWQRVIISKSGTDMNIRRQSSLREVIRGRRSVHAAGSTVRFQFGSAVSRSQSVCIQEASAEPSPLFGSNKLTRSERRLESSCVSPSNAMRRYVRGLIRSCYLLGCLIHSNMQRALTLQVLQTSCIVCKLQPGSDLTRLG